MSGAVARRLIRALTEKIEAYDAFLDALPPGTRITLTVQLTSSNLVKYVRLSTEDGGQAEINGNRVNVLKSESRPGLQM